MDYGCVVASGSIGFAHALDKAYEKNTGVRLTARCFGLRNLEEELSFTDTGGLWGSWLGRPGQHSVWDLLALIFPSNTQVEGLCRQFEYKSLEFRGRAWA